MVWKYENTVTSKYAPEVVWDFLTNYDALDHNSPVFLEENGGQAWPREVTQLGGGKVNLKDTAKRFSSELTVDLSDRPNKIPTEGTTSMGPWKGMTTITRTPEGGTNWQSRIEIAPNRFGAKLIFALFGGKLRKSFQKHERQHFIEMEASMAAK